MSRPCYFEPVCNTVLLTFASCLRDVNLEELEKLGQNALDQVQHSLTRAHENRMVFCTHTHTHTHTHANTHRAVRYLLRRLYLFHSSSANLHQRMCTGAFERVQNAPNQIAAHASISGRKSSHAWSLVRLVCNRSSDSDKCTSTRVERAQH
jgi:hypothetical protein